MIDERSGRHATPFFHKYFYGKMNKKYRFWVISKKGQLCTFAKK